MYRHHRKTLIGHGSEKDTIGTPEDAQTESRGVRICIPLARIREYQSEWWAAFASILSIAVEHEAPQIGGDVVTPGGLKDAFQNFIDHVPPPLKISEQPKKETKRLSCPISLGSNSTIQTNALSSVASRSTDGYTSPDSPPSGAHHVPPSPGPWLQTNPGSNDSESLAQVLHLSVLQRDPKWDQFDKLVKARRESGAPDHAQVVMDWGELVFDELPGSEEHAESTTEVKVEAEPAEMSSAERKIRRLFALGDHQAVWSE
jgi:hypothetical protein